jgi:hypothetical protein
MKIHILGLPSSGKTTLARELSLRLELPHHDLDAVAFVDERWTPRPPVERDRLVSDIVSKPSFVTEGFFIEWTTPLFSAADHIIWLDPSLLRLIFRHLLRHRSQLISRPFWLVARVRFQVLSYYRGVGSGPGADPTLTRSGIESALRPWGNKLLRVRRSVSVDQILEALDL